MKRIRHAANGFLEIIGLRWGENSVHIRDLPRWGQVALFGLPLVVVFVLSRVYWR